MPNIDSEGLAAIRQALGLNHAALPYRNHYAAPAADPLMARLMAQGLMRTGSAQREARNPRPSDQAGQGASGLVLYHVTAAGARAVRTTLPDLSPQR
jgi:hypothetical protein